MNLHLKIFLFIFGFSSLFGFPCSSADPTDKNIEKIEKQPVSSAVVVSDPLSYSLECPLEEKWRWRKNFKIYADNSVSPKTLIDFYNTHNDLAVLEFEINRSGVVLEKDTNILIPAITVIYSKDGELRNSTGYIYNYIPAYKETRSFVTFLSGAARTSSSNVIKLFDTNYSLLSSFHLSINSEDRYKNLQEFYKHKNHEDHTLDAFCQFASKIASTIINPDNRGTYFSHSEQWLIYYLSKQNYKSTRYDNLCKSIASAVRREKNINITNVILHMHSTYDVCDVCSPSLSVFLEELNDSKNKDIIINALKSGILERNDSTAEFDKSFNFSIITSSTKSHLGQSRFRNHYHYTQGEHGKRRIYFGIDKISHNSDSVTNIGNMELPYLYIQVPIKEIKINVGDNITF